jgi:uncharacterized protein (TIGR03083 family)
VETSDHIVQLRSDGERFGSLLERANLDATVPTCPDWTVRDLARHLGGVHRWATAYVRDGLDVPDADLEATAGPWPSDAELPAWFRGGHDALVAALGDAPEDLSCWTFLEAPSPRAFWARRQAHETAIHRVDLDGATGSTGAFPPAFAADGIDELLFAFLGRPGRAPRVAAPATLRLEAEDTPRAWNVGLSSERFDITSDVPAACTDAFVRGTASDLYMLMWNRGRSDGLEIRGDVSALDSWASSVVVRWS